MTLLAVRQVSKIYGSYQEGTAKKALSSVDLSIDDGEFVSLIGPSGCGKSTLLNILAGLDTPTEGDVMLNGTASTADERLSFNAYMFQTDLLMPWRSVEGNVALGLLLNGVSKADATDRARRTIEEVGLADVRNADVRTLSGGMRQRVALARTLVLDRPILMLDEPFGALDSLTRTLMQEWLLDVWEAHRKSVVLVTHDIDEAVFLSDRVVWMHTKPGRVGGSMTLDLPRPRSREVTTDQRYLDYRKFLLDRIHDDGKQTIDRNAP